LTPSANIMLTICLLACLSPGSRDWRRAPEDLRPDNTIVLEGGTACETDFQDCSGEEECDVEVAGAKVPLQRLVLTIPAGQQGVGGITFVLRRYVRTADGPLWVWVAKDFCFDLKT
jgi:alpha-glucan,water dikinase